MLIYQGFQIDFCSNADLENNVKQDSLVQISNLLHASFLLRWRGPYYFFSLPFYSLTFVINHFLQVKCELLGNKSSGSVIILMRLCYCFSFFLLWHIFITLFSAFCDMFFSILSVSVFFFLHHSNTFSLMCKQETVFLKLMQIDSCKGALKRNSSKI